MKKLLLAFTLVLLTNTAIARADGLLIATGGTATVQPVPTGFADTSINITGTNGTMFLLFEEALLGVQCLQAGCPNGSNIAVSVHSGGFPDFFQINLDGLTRTCNGPIPTCQGSFFLDAVAMIPENGGEGLIGLFSVTVPFTFHGSVGTGGESFSFSGGGFASFSLDRPGPAHYVVASNMQYNFVNAPEPASMILLGSGLIGLAGWAKRRRRVTNS